MKKREDWVKSIKKVTIVGGGTAGWVTALSLLQNPFLEITLIQPKGGNSIGVGESTQPDFLNLIASAGIDLHEFIKASDATFKCGIYYEDWNEVGTHYWHPFSGLTKTGTYTIAHHYQQLIKQDPEKYTHEGYYDAVHPSYGVCVKNNLLDTDACTALHIDADKMHRFVRSKLENHVHVVEPETIEIFSEDDEISYILCDGQIRYFSDLWIDCTGFNHVLCKEINNTEVSYYHENVESAIFARIPYVDREKEMIPYTKAHAQEHGWIWTIPLHSRIGSGYVYTRNSCTPEEAEAQFRAYWGEERTKDLKFNHLTFRSDALKTPWKNNVVAIGLSGGFVEPLEATGINWIVTAAGHLTEHIGRGYYDAQVIDSYNNGMTNYVQDVQDFIDVHYKLSSRRDSKLWQHHTMRGHHPRLMERLRTYKEYMPTRWNRLTNLPWAFNEISWIDILNGYKFEYDKLENVSPEVIAGVEKEMRRQKLLREGRMKNCKSQVQLLKEIYDLFEMQRMEKLPDQQHTGS